MYILYNMYLDFHSMLKKINLFCSKIRFYDCHHILRSVSCFNYLEKFMKFFMSGLQPQPWCRKSKTLSGNLRFVAKVQYSC